MKGKQIKYIFVAWTSKLTNAKGGYCIFQSLYQSSDMYACATEASVIKILCYLSENCRDSLAKLHILNAKRHVQILLL